MIAPFATSFLLGLIHYATAQDIISCGGFVKVDSESAPKLDLTQIQVKLLTRDGLVKYATEPAPNGYYMLPVYEQGDYEVQIQPQSGWNFEPSEPVNLDLLACERNEDVNFIFSGFELYGQVLNAGASYGPSDITVTLIRNSKELRSVKTIDGRYTFTSVLPGDYVVRVSHDSLLFSKAETSVTVHETAVTIDQPLTIHGYSVSGRISNEGQPVKGVSFVLKSDSGEKVDVKGCTSGSPPNFTQQSVLCFVLSDEAGKFVFSSVPVGKYTIVPFHKGERTVFDVMPKQYSFSVSDSEVAVEPEFTISGFGVSGQVRYSGEGRGVSDAIVSFDGKRVATTDSQGLYAVDGMRAGTYTISVQAPHLYFDDIQVKVLPSDPLLPKIIASRFDLCGKILVESQKVSEMSVSVANVKRQEQSEMVSVDSEGVFCLPVRPASYIIKPMVDTLSPALTLTPASIKVQVTDKPLIGEAVKFSLFKAVLSGKVRCLANCGGMEVLLTSADGHAAPKTQKITSTSTSVAFVFQGVAPGRYTLSALRPSWCWADESLTVTVHDSDVDGIILEQRGYSAKVETSRVLEISCDKLESTKDTETKKFTLKKGMNEICVPSSGKFEIVPLSCHLFDKQSYIFDTETMKEAIKVKVIKHKVTIRLVSQEHVNDVHLSIRAGQDVIDAEMPKTAEGNHQRDGVFIYTLEKELDVSVKSIVVTPRSGQVLFEHAEYETAVDGAVCPAATVTMRASAGVFVEGAVSPIVAGLNIRVLQGDDLIIEGMTDEQGKYRFGPLPAHLEYSVIAEKTGYVVDQDEKNPRNFKVFKLAEVAVQVEGAQGEKLDGVILSLSSQSFRSNNRTDKNGQFSFIGLSPGMYYLKAILKEYEFSPVSVEVKEGITGEVVVVGKRVAYSVFGSAVNLRSEAVSQRIHIKARGIKGQECINTEESSQGQVDGKFRIRGLKMEAADANIGKFTISESLAVTDVAVFINCSTQYLSTLKVIISKEGSSAPLQSLGASESKVIFLSSLPMDSSKYKVMLESSLSKKLYEYETSEYLMTADEPAKALAMSFNPKVRSNFEYEVKESSLLALLIVVLSTLLLVNKQACFDMFSQVANTIMSQQ
ncbi:BOS complex subunit NOMO3-like isoform X2 [Watersipora subatra]|uniref:BOS complex subunit NOMO3-like isoform X2 n=1 Tax=Watersipora subatra TaxID=2589382 RepID=UPI00355BD34B